MARLHEEKLPPWRAASSASPRRPIARPHLFTLLDERLLHGHVLVAAPAGFGKSTLLRTYCEAAGRPLVWSDADARHGGAGADRDPTALLVRLEEDGLLVVDDFAAQDAPLAMELCARVLHSDARQRIVFLSRTPLLEALSRLRVNGQLQVVAWDALLLSQSEATTWAAEYGVDAAAAKCIFERSGGWVAGFVALLQTERARSEHLADLGMPAALDAYLTNEVLQAFPLRDQRVLRKLCFALELDEALAAQLAGPHAVTAMRRLYQEGLFLARERGEAGPYVLQPLLRALLRRQAHQSMGARAARELTVRTATACEAAGNLLDAHALYCELGQWTDALRVFCAHAPVLVAQGKHRVALTLCSAIPDTQLAQAGHARFWRGVALYPFQPGEAQALFEGALDQMAAAGDHAAATAAWCHIIECCYHQWHDFLGMDRWLDWMLPRLASVDYSSLSPELQIQVAANLTTALTIRRPWHAELETWAQRAASGALAAKDPRLALSALMAHVNYVTWVCPTELSWSLFAPLVASAAKQDADPLLRLQAQLVELFVALWCRPDPERVLDLADDATALAEGSAFKVMSEVIGSVAAHAALLRGDLGRAEALVARLEGALEGARRAGYSLYSYLLVPVRLARGDHEGACVAARDSVAAARASGYCIAEALCRQLLASALAANGDLSAAEAEAKLALEQAENARSALLICSAKLSLAFVAHRGGRRADAIAWLRQGLAISREHHLIVHPLWWHPVAMAELATSALVEDIEVEHVRAIVRARHLLPPAREAVPASWPWPCRIHALGALRVEAEGAGASAGPSARQKPGQLLGVLVAKAGAGVQANLLADILWPEAEADAAYSALTTTLARLRKSMGLDVVRIEHGQVSLDLDRCWVDAFAFEKLAHAARQSFARGDDDEGWRCAREALALYQAELLAGEEDFVWAKAARARLQALARWLFSTAATRERAAGRPEQALDLLLRAVELEPLSEELCQLLMVTYCDLGRHADAVFAYRRFEAALREELGIEPSPTTRRMCPGR